MFFFCIFAAVVLLTSLARVYTSKDNDEEEEQNEGVDAMLGLCHCDRMGGF